MVLRSRPRPSPYLWFARVIKSSGGNLHGHLVPSNVSCTAAAVTLSPRPFGSSHFPRAWWYMRQIRSGSWVDTKRIDPPRRESEKTGIVQWGIGDVTCPFWWVRAREKWYIVCIRGLIAGIVI